MYYHLLYKLLLITNCLTHIRLQQILLVLLPYIMASILSLLHFLRPILLNLQLSEILMLIFRLNQISYSYMSILQHLFLRLTSYLSNCLIILLLFHSTSSLEVLFFLPLQLVLLLSLLLSNLNLLHKILPYSYLLSLLIYLLIQVVIPSSLSLSLQ